MIGIEALSLLQQYGADPEEKEKEKEKEKETSEPSGAKTPTVQLRLGQGQGQGGRQGLGLGLGQAVVDRGGISKRKSSTPSRSPGTALDSWEHHRSPLSLSLSLLSESPHMIAPLIAAAELKHKEKQGLCVINSDVTLLHNIR